MRRVFLLQCSKYPPPKKGSSLPSLSLSLSFSPRSLSFSSPPLFSCFVLFVIISFMLKFFSCISSLLMCFIILLEQSTEFVLIIDVLFVNLRLLFVVVFYVVILSARKFVSNIFALIHIYVFFLCSFSIPFSILMCLYVI